MLKNKISFKKVSITNDYTLGERKMIRTLVDEANGYVWKVRGAPKEGMRIIKILK